MTPEILNDYPNYWLIYFAHIFNQFVIFYAILKQIWEEPSKNYYFRLDWTKVVTGFLKDDVVQRLTFTSPSYPIFVYIFWYELC